MLGCGTIVQLPLAKGKIQLDFNTFLSFYTPILNDVWDKDIAKIKDALIQAKEVFNIYKSWDNKIKFNAEDLASKVISDR